LYLGTSLLLSLFIPIMHFGVFRFLISGLNGSWSHLKKLSSIRCLLFQVPIHL
jgi:hypothetical protein